MSSIELISTQKCTQIISGISYLIMTLQGDKTMMRLSQLFIYLFLNTKKSLMCLVPLWEIRQHKTQLSNEEEEENNLKWNHKANASNKLYHLLTIPQEANKKVTCKLRWNPALDRLTDIPENEIIQVALLPELSKVLNQQFRSISHVHNIVNCFENARNKYPCHSQFHRLSSFLPNFYLTFIRCMASIFRQCSQLLHYLLQDFSAPLRVNVGMQ